MSRHPLPLLLLPASAIGVYNFTFSCNDSWISLQGTVKNSNNKTSCFNGVDLLQVHSTTSISLGVCKGLLILNLNCRVSSG